MGLESMLNLFEAFVSSKSKPKHGRQGNRVFCCSFRLSSSEVYRWLTSQWLHGPGLSGWAVSSQACACHCPEPSMAPTVHEAQPDTSARGQLWSPQTRAPFWLWDPGLLCCAVLSRFRLCDPKDRLLCPWGFSRPEYWNGLCQALLQGIFPTEGSNLGLPHCMWTLDRLSHQGRQG